MNDDLMARFIVQYHSVIHPPIRSSVSSFVRSFFLIYFLPSHRKSKNRHLFPVCPAPIEGGVTKASNKGVQPFSIMSFSAQTCDAVPVKWQCIMGDKNAVSLFILGISIIYRVGTSWRVGWWVGWGLGSFIMATTVDCSPTVDTAEIRLWRF